MGLGLGGALGLSAGAGLVSGLMGQQSQNQAYSANRRLQQQQWNQNLESLKPEWRFTPEQLELQEGIVPQYQAQLAYALGGGENQSIRDMFYSPPERQEIDTLSAEYQSLQDAINQEQINIHRGQQEVAWLRPTGEGGDAMTALGQAQSRLAGLQQQQTELSQPIDQSGYQSAFETEMQRQQLLGQQKQQQFQQMAGQSLGTLGEAVRGGTQRALEGGRAAFGNALSGRTLESIMDVQNQAVPLELQAKMYPEQAMMDYRSGLAGSAQQGLNQYMTQPLGNLPIGQMQEPLYQTPDYSMQDTMNNMANIGLMAMMMRGNKQQ